LLLKSGMSKCKNSIQKRVTKKYGFTGKSPCNPMIFPFILVFFNYILYILKTGKNKILTYKIK
jgi:hypothetical protein